MNRLKLYIYFVLGVLCVGCNENSMALFESTAPSVDGRFDVSMQYNDEFGYVTIQANDDEYNVYVCADPHVETVNTKLQTFIQLYRDDRKCPVAICLGDLVGTGHSYVWFGDAFNHVKKDPAKSDTMFIAIGNHDLYYDHWSSYVQFCPTSTYYFVVETNGKNRARDLYICLDTAQGTLGKKQLQWLKSLLERTSDEGFRNIIVYSHVNIFRRDNTSADISTISLEEAYELMYLFTKYGVKQYLAGHDHAREEFVQGGVKYILVDSMEEENTSSAYMIIHVEKGEINNTFHPIISSVE